MWGGPGQDLSTTAGKLAVVRRGRWRAQRRVSDQAHGAPVTTILPPIRPKMVRLLFHRRHQSAD